MAISSTTKLINLQHYLFTLFLDQVGGGGGGGGGGLPYEMDRDARRLA